MKKKIRMMTKRDIMTLIYKTREVENTTCVDLKDYKGYKNYGMVESTEPDYDFLAQKYKKVYLMGKEDKDSVFFFLVALCTTWDNKKTFRFLMSNPVIESLADYSDTDGIDLIGPCEHRRLYHSIEMDTDIPVDYVQSGHLAEQASLKNSNNIFYRKFEFKKYGDKGVSSIVVHDNGNGYYTLTGVNFVEEYDLKSDLLE